MISYKLNEIKQAENKEISVIQLPYFLADANPQATNAWSIAFWSMHPRTLQYVQSAQMQKDFA